jgi:hypothetical protein
MKLKLRNKTFNIRSMSASRLTRLISCVNHEATKELSTCSVKKGYTPKYQMLEFTLEILKSRLTKKLAIQRVFIINNY